MSLTLVSVAALAALALGYRFYSRLLARRFALDDRNVTPAVAREDGVDFVPTPKALLLPQHFSAIAAAGPIVGPILAGLWFGWLPALLWIVLGNVFIGAAHDFSALVASVRNGARSIGELVRQSMSPRAWAAFLCFVWLALVYVVVAFTDITAATFVARDVGPAVASSSTLYLGLAMLLGLVIRKWGPPAWLLALVAVPALGFIIWVGPHIPLTLPAALGPPAKVWGLFILGYCVAASLLPLWLLLQPRGFLGGWFLYGALGIGLVGLLSGNFSLQYPAFLGMTGPKGQLLVPVMFITIACGACSGFHGLVCSGTTSRQLERETDARMVGYGGMLLEGLVAVVALATVMVLAPGSKELAAAPTEIYARGLAKFAQILGVPVEIALTFGLLAFATFVYDTLDVATRLARYILQELFGWSGRKGAVLATLLSVALPAVFILTTGEQAYLKFWPVFGASNQLLAALTLLALAVWLVRGGKSAWFVAAPMAFVMAMTVWTLGMQARAGLLGERFDLSGVVALLLIALAALLCWEAWRAVTGARAAPAAQAERS